MGFRLAVVVSCLLWGLTVCLSSAIAATAGNLDGLAFRIQFDKQTFILGEPVSLIFRVTNQSGKPIELPNVVDVLGGNVRLQIAFENGPYREYHGPGWGLVNRVHSQPLDPGGSVETSATVLHHRAPKRGTLNERTWKRITESTIDTEIAVSKPGRYRLKAILFNKIESPPLEIHVGEPQKIDDIEVWNIMSAEPEYVLFMQSGSVLRGKITDQRVKEFVDELEKLVNFHSTSTYAPHFRAAIEKHKMDLEKIKGAKLK